MTIIWLVVWLLAGTPTVEPYNGWLITLIITLAFDGVCLIVTDDGDWF